MSVHNDLDNRMKKYEKAGQRYLTRRTPVILRIDGCHFRTFTRGFQKPFDDVLIKTMQETTKYLCENIQGCVLGYTQSDEITLILTDYKKLTSSAWFDNRQNKIESVAASMATMAFNKAFGAYSREFIFNNGENFSKDSVEYKLCLTYRRALKNGAYFDCRAFNIPVDDVTNNVYWRQIDASHNSIQMLGHYYFSDKELYKKSRNDILDMLMTQKGINWNDLPTYKKRGSCVVRNGHNKINNPNGTTTVELRDTSKSENEWIVDINIPQFKEDGRKYVEELIRFEY